MAKFCRDEHQFMFATADRVKQKLVAQQGRVERDVRTAMDMEQKTEVILGHLNFFLARSQKFESILLLTYQKIHSEATAMFYRVEMTSPLKAALHPAITIAEEATKQLETVEYFWICHLKYRGPVGLWDSKKDLLFKYPSNYLELRHKATPSAVFGEDQSPSSTKKGVRETSN
ncbi:MAG: hypothetical protein Q9175_004965 [Cornicularia normoerica]